MTDPKKLPPPILVADDAGLTQLTEDLAGQQRIAVDTEADSFYSYKEKVCLVQITVEDRDYLVDPLAVDIAPLGDMLADPRKIKVFHDGEYDVLVLKRDYAFEFAGLFDTRVAAAALGMEAPGLASVLKDRFGVELDKSMQRSNWAERPLSDKQVDYARLDTHYLLPLMDVLKEELEQRERTMIVEGECRRLEALVPTRPEFSADGFVKIKGSRTLKPLERQVLRELYALREKLAEAADIPLFRVMNNQVLVELARRRPRDARALSGVHGFSKGMVRRIGDRTLEAIERAHEKGPLEKLPRLPKRDGTSGFDEYQLDLFDRLRDWRKGMGIKFGIESSYLLNRHVMAAIARERPRDRDALAGIDGLIEWQLELFGDSLLEVLSGFERDVKRGNVPKNPPRHRRR